MTLTAGQTLTYKSENASSSWIDVTTTIKSNVSTVYAAHVNGFAVSSSTAAPSSAASSSIIASSTAMTSISSASGTAKYTSEGGLSAGADAGIGIGVGSAAIIGISVAAVLFFRRRASRRDQANTSTKYPSFLPQQQRAELEGPLYELSGSREPDVEARWELGTQKF